MTVGVALSAYEVFLCCLEVPFIMIKVIKMFVDFSRSTNFAGMAVLILALDLGEVEVHLATSTAYA